MARHNCRYAYGAAMVFNVLIGDLCFIQIFLDLLQPAGRSAGFHATQI